MLHQTDGQPADNVDQHDHDAGNRIAPDKLGGTVHRAKEVGFVGNLRPASFGVFFANQAGVQVGVNRHLLAWHGVQGEACAHFGNPTGALGDHQKVDDGQDDEHHDTDGVIAADQEVGECLNHLAGSIRAVMPVEQDGPAGRHVQRQSQQGGHQQHGWKRRELQRLAGIQPDHQHDDRHGNIEGKENVQQHRRQRQDHHPQNHDDEDRACQ